MDSLDILGDLDFKVEYPLLAMFQIGKYFFGKYFFGKYLFLFQEFVAIMKEVAESSASPEVVYKRGTKDRKIANKLFYAMDLGSLTILRWTTGKRSGCLQKTRTAAFRSRR